MLTAIATMLISASCPSASQGGAAQPARALNLALRTTWQRCAVRWSTGPNIAQILAAQADFAQILALSLDLEVGGAI